MSLFFPNIDLIGLDLHNSIFFNIYKRITLRGGKIVLTNRRSKLPFPDNCFNFVVLLCVTDKIKIWSEIERVSKPNCRWYFNSIMNSSCFYYSKKINYILYIIKLKKFYKLELEKE